MVGATDFDPDAILGNICHIESSSDDGPRANPKLSPKARDEYPNLILLCRHHHGLVDDQHSTFTTAELLEWKGQHEAAVEGTRRITLVQVMNRVNFPELEAAASVLMATTGTMAEKLIALPASTKMRRNDLGSASHFMLTMGASKADEVARFLAAQTQLDDTYAKRLRAGFVAEYRRLWAEGLRGDELFEGMRTFACGGMDQSDPRKLAGLPILSHLFMVCDVFESA